jgi:hypothetical protein
MARDAPSLQKRGRVKPMPIYKHFAVTGSVLLAFLFVSDTFLGDSDANSRFNRLLYESALYAPSSAKIAVTDEPRFARDTTPASRVRQVFALFEGKRDKRYSSLETFVR